MSLVYYWRKRRARYGRSWLPNFEAYGAGPSPLNESARFIIGQVVCIKSEKAPESVGPSRIYPGPIISEAQ